LTGSASAVRAAPAVGVPSAIAASVDASLPNIAQFQTNRSDRFLVDIQHVCAGHPFKGRRALQPHQGAHVHWDNSANTWPKGGVAVLAVGQKGPGRVEMVPFG
jgi:hypothetical protein